MKLLLFTAPLLLLVTISAPAEAHAESYFLFKDCAKAQCSAVSPGCDLTGGSGGFGTVCFPAWHIDPGWTGRVTVTISDLLFHPIGLWACQKGGFDVTPPPICGDEPEDYVVVGCASLILDIQMGWDPYRAITVFAGGPLLTLEQCGVVGFGTTGTITHI